MPIALHAARCASAEYDILARLITAATYADIGSCRRYRHADDDLHFADISSWCFDARGALACPRWDRELYCCRLYDASTPRRLISQKFNGSIPAQYFSRRLFHWSPRIAAEMWWLPCGIERCFHRQNEPPPPLTRQQKLSRRFRIRDRCILLSPCITYQHCRVILAHYSCSALPFAYVYCRL